MGTKTKITYLDALQAVQALGKLDTYKDGNETHHYKFTGGALVNIAKNLRVLKTAAEDYDNARVKLVKQFTDGDAPLKEGDDKWPQFVTAVNGLLNEEVELDIMRIKLSSLKLDANPVPASVLSALMFLIEEDDAA